MGWKRWGWLDEWGYNVETEIWVSKGEHECLRDALAFACPNRPIAAEDLWGKKLRYAVHIGLMERSGRSCPSEQSFARDRTSSMADEKGTDIWRNGIRSPERWSAGDTE